MYHRQTTYNNLYTTIKVTMWKRIHCKPLEKKSNNGKITKVELNK
jgi:hypothetical protein